MSNRKDIGLVLTDFIAIYNYFEKPASYEEGIQNMNGGWCGVVASICAYIIRTKFDIQDIKIRSNAFHIWLAEGNTDYDTLYPEGYRGSVAGNWLLKEINQSVDFSEVNAGEEVNKGYWDWGYVYIFKSMCERWGIPLPTYFSSYEAGAERMTTNREVRGRKKRMEDRFKSSLSIPLPTSVKTNKVLPFPHYEYTENEENENRTLKPIDFKTLEGMMK